ncbi:hypothetical protein ATE69_11265 [Sphingopyxis sp. H071]|jgi:hypothetical protein|nr:hypothetical protein ATE61_08790 [Sphingopyxis sp. H057]KTE51498.1 hypothetical protein ATE64_13210 [Sphingopyxis sp. H073]KTE54001.1 hypothetical protein ATE69_11265 [Sphingopyxis sp. H071]KTE60281.1 hypothetical protein ATE66_08675 [Sphingopyxis sp. H107]KTE65624.1 hypothetical protein ATE65_08790 [Sphingopyxis sp. H100]KTE73229.1 hypothetical protein ATE60_06785 [Sphingopyxis sp. H081]KTE81217.1 hypothetical protein ATE63_08130 [Sphingopyxis sp. H067]
MIKDMIEYGHADLVQDRLGLNLVVGQKVAAIITFSAAIEHHLERALWTLRQMNPAGTRPDTDNKNITDLIGMLEHFAAGLEAGDVRNMIETWCKAARSGFVIRNNIVHGTPGCIDGVLLYMRNGRWGDIIRKREFGDFWAHEDTLDLVRQAMAVLMRIILQLTKEDVAPAKVATPEAMKALRTARSVLGEFADQYYNPSYEKY